MPLIPGTRLGSFEILSLLGAGGMGEVYRARDTKLGREVAIKVLPDAVAKNAERLARFDREARTLALLNHPNIAQIHGLEDRALVMELVEGEDLSARIQRGPMPIEDSLPIARQLAGALDAAHSVNIVHRDLKPANIKLRPDGTVKVLDFGLAKALDPNSGSEAALANSPTITSPAAMTQLGVILGTAAYMSPEQARGRPVDKRADIWAFGCVLYEMLAGRRAFEGETATDILGAIVKTEPDWTQLPAGTPSNVLALLKHCLRKDPAKRLRDIGDADAMLDVAADLPVIVARGRRGRRPLLWAAAALLLAGAAGTLGYLAKRAPEPSLLKFQAALQVEGGTIREPNISPDGRRVVFVGQSRLWVQDLSEWQARELQGTEAPSRPFWSPDGAWIAYFRSEALLKVPVGGGPVMRVATLPASQGRFGQNSGAWGRDGVITISMGSGPLLRVSEGGGEPRPFTITNKDVIGFRDLAILPNGNLIGVVQTVAAVLAGFGVLEGDTIRTVLAMPNARFPSYTATGHLVFQRYSPATSIWAVRFSSDRVEVSGEPFLIAEGSEPSTGGNALVFKGREEGEARQLAWFTLDGAVTGRIGEPREWSEGVAISRDGRRVLASATDGIWLYDTTTGARSRVTTGTDDITPVWLSNDKMLFVRYSLAPELILKPASTLGGERVLATAARFPRVTADGRRVVYNVRKPNTPFWRVAWIDIDAPSDVHMLASAHDGASFPSVSPDGGLVAYTSGEMGHDEVFVTRMPGGEGKWQISTDGGGPTFYSPAGDGVFYRAPSGSIMFVPVSSQNGELRIGKPQKKFDWGAGWAPFYDLAADGTRGITAVPLSRRVIVPRLSIIQNWHLEFPHR